MSGEKKIETSEMMAPCPMSDSSVKLPETEMGKEGRPSNSIPSLSANGDAASGKKGVIGQPSASKQSVYYPSTNCYDYYYSGYNGTFPQSEEKGYFNQTSGSYTGIQSDNASLLYYLPSYGAYPTGQTYPSSDYLQQPCSYGSDAFPCYMYDSTHAANGLIGAARSLKPGMGSSTSGKSNAFNAPKPNNSLSSKISALPFTSTVHQPVSDFPKSIYQNQPLNKFSSSFQPTALMKGFQPTGRFSSYTSRNPGVLMQHGPVNYQPSGRIWNNNYRSKIRESFARIGESEPATELTRGPRTEIRNNASSAEVGFHVERSKYNLQEFQTEYDNAKFYVIKSYSEDDVHKSIKYDVWSSTPNGNKTLDAAFHEADAKTSEKGIKCPVFLFFSVNGSGQFVGVAEMMGQVDFSKKMDFWQLDKWNAFFPVKWHIIKDVPNMVLRHITLENNENKPVTYTRDTQEIGLKQGLEMLNIFKNYAAKTSVLDDFDFYESREKSLKAKKNAKPVAQTNGFKNGSFEKHFENGGGMIGEQSAKSKQADASSLVSLTQNLSINSQPL